jgi:hypothetical protein
MVGMHHCATLDELTDQVAALAVDVLRYYDSDVILKSDAPANFPPPRQKHPECVTLSPDADRCESLVATEPLVVYLTYPKTVALPPARPSDLRVRILNPTDRAMDANLKIRVPDGWWSSKSDLTLSLAAMGSETVDFVVSTPPINSVRAYYNPLDLNFEANGLRWTVTAGLVTTIPWLRWPLEKMTESCPKPPDGAEIIGAFGHFQPLPDGVHAFTTEIKLPYTCTLRYIVQSPREVRVWLDGEEINHHDGSYRVPAIHRAGATGKDVQKRRGWHRLTVATGAGEGGKLFVGIGDGQSWDWLRTAEWRLPLSGS